MPGASQKTGFFQKIRFFLCKTESLAMPGASQKPDFFRKSGFSCAKRKIWKIAMKCQQNLIPRFIFPNL